MGTVFEALLPSGRGVRYLPVTTDVYLEAHDASVGKIGGSVQDAKTAAWNARANLRQQIELVARTLVEISAPIEPVFKQGDESELDVDAMLDGTKSWIKLNYVTLTTDGAQFSLSSVLSSPSDLAAMVALVEQTMAPTRELKVFSGKVRSRSS